MLFDKGYRVQSAEIRFVVAWKHDGENEEYAIVETKTAYGISLYDHIALDASKISENQLTSK